MWTSILSAVTAVFKFLSSIIPSWQYTAGKKAALLEQSAIKDKLDAVYDKIDRKYLSPDDAIELLIIRSKDHYGKMPNSEASTGASASVRAKTK